MSVCFTDLDFADDVALLAKMLSVLVLALEVMNEEAQPLGLTINWAKTKIQTTDVTVPPGSTVQVGGSNVEVVDTFTYLGCQLQSYSSGESEHEVNRRISISRNCLQMLDRHIWRSMVLSEYQTSALQRLYTPGIFIWSRNVVHNQSYREEN